MMVWLALLWLKYKELIPGMRKQLETVIEKVAQGRRMDLDWKLRNAKDVLTQYNIWSTDTVTIALRMKVDSLYQARDSLDALKGRTLTLV